MVDFDEVRKEVAIKHGVLLDENDPMLMTVTINEVILNQYVEMVASQNAEYVKSVEAAIQKGIADSKLTAGRVITEGGNYVSERVRATVVEVLKEIEEKNKSKPKIEAEEKPSWWKDAVSAGRYSAFLVAVIVMVLYLFNSMGKI